MSSLVVSLLDLETLRDHRAREKCCLLIVDCFQKIMIPEALAREGQAASLRFSDSDSLHQLYREYLASTWPTYPSAQASSSEDSHLADARPFESGLGFRHRT